MKYVVCVSLTRLLCCPLTSLVDRAVAVLQLTPLVQGTAISLEECTVTAADNASFVPATGRHYLKLAGVTEGTDALAEYATKPQPTSASLSSKVTHGPSHTHTQCGACSRWRRAGLCRLDSARSHSTPVPTISFHNSR